MHYLTHYKKTSRVLRLSAVAQASAVLLVCMGSQVHALGFGRVHVHSALGQPLRAEIELNGVKGDKVRAGMAPASVYTQKRLEYGSVASGVRSQLAQKPDGRVVMSLHSDLPVTEPFVDLVVQAADADGQIVKDFSLLLDPAKHTPVGAAVLPKHEQGSYGYSDGGSRTAAIAGRTAPPVNSHRTRSVHAVDPIPAEETSSSRRRLDRRHVSRSTAAQTAGRVVRSASSKAGRYSAVSRPVDTARKGKIPGHSLRVRYGQTASGIAAARRKPGTTLSQMLVALVQVNPHAFVDGNVHRLRAGAVLQMPTLEQVHAVPADQARQLLSRNQGVVTYQSRIGHAPVTMNRQASSAYTVASAASKAQAASAIQSAAVTDTVEQRGGSALVEGREKVASQAVRPELGAQTEQASQTSPVVITSVPLVAPSAAKPSATTDQMISGKDDLISSTEADRAMQPLVGTSEVETNLTPKEGGAAAQLDALPPLPATLASSGADLQSSSLDAAPPSVDKQHQEPAGGSSNYLQSLFDDPLILGGGVALLALLGGAGYLQLRRRKAERSTWIGAGSAVGGDSIQFGLTGFERPAGEGEGRLSELTQVGGEFVYSAMEYSHSQLRHAGDEVDAVMEADVYLAYGRDTQAEEILRDAVNSRPTWVAAHAKLLEIYRSRRDPQAYAETAAIVKALTHGQGPEWNLARNNGLALDPDNPLYQEEEAQQVTTDSAIAQGVAPAGTVAVGALAHQSAVADTLCETGVPRKVVAKDAEPDFLLSGEELSEHVAAPVVTGLSAESELSAFTAMVENGAFTAMPGTNLGVHSPSSVENFAAVSPGMSAVLPIEDDASLHPSSLVSFAQDVPDLLSQDLAAQNMGGQIQSDGEQDVLLNWQAANNSAALTDVPSVVEPADVRAPVELGAATSSLHHSASTGMGAATEDATSSGVVLDWNQPTTETNKVASQLAAWQSDTAILTENNVMLSSRASSLLKSARAEYSQSAATQPDFDISLDLSDLESSASGAAEGIALSAADIPTSAALASMSTKEDVVEFSHVSDSTTVATDETIGQQTSSIQQEDVASQHDLTNRRNPSFADGLMVPDSSTLQTAVPGASAKQGSPFLGQLLGAMRTPADIYPMGHMEVVPPPAKS